MNDSQLYYRRRPVWWVPIFTVLNSAIVADAKRIQDTEFIDNNIQSD